MNEERRLEGLYRTYEADPDTQRRWDLTNPGNAAILAERDVRLLGHLRGAGVSLEGATIVDVGAGSGDLVRTLLGFGASTDAIVAVDLRRSAFERARAAGSDWPMVQGDGTRLPVRGGSADVVLVFTVLTSVPRDDDRARICAEAMRIGRAGGLVVVYDMVRSNPRNRNIRRTSASFIRECFPGCEISAARLTLFPPLARRIPSRWYRRLAPIAWLDSHVMVAVRLP